MYQPRTFRDSFLCFFMRSGLDLHLHLSLHDALPIYAIRAVGVPVVMGGPHVTEEADEALGRNGGPRHDVRSAHHHRRSEEHTSELQSPVQLVCRLLLEKKIPSEVRRRELRAGIDD